MVAQDRHKNLDHSTCASLKRQTLQDDVVFIGLRDVNQRVLDAMSLEHIRIYGVAYLAAKRLPEVSHAHLGADLSHLGGQPTLQTVEVQKANSSFTLADREEGVLH